jgi:hypothetical protein
MSASGAIEDIKNEVLRAAETLSIKIAGVGSIDPAAASELRARLVEAFSSAGISASQQPSLHVVQTGEKSAATDIELFIVELLSGEERPMSLEQLYDIVQSSTQFDIKRETLGVKLHRLSKAPQNKIVNTSRGHYWIPEASRQNGSR